MIKRIKIANLRSKNFDLGLEPLTLIIGSNTAGKTTIADAIRWGLLGYIPNMAKPPRGWTDLLGNGVNEASVELTLTKGSVKRRLYLEHGSPKSDGLAEAGFDEINVLGLDPALFLQSTGPVRAQMVADATIGGFDWRALVPDELKEDDFENWHSWPSWIEHALMAARDLRGMAATNKKSLAATLRTLEGLREIVLEDDAGIKARLDEGKEKLGSLKEQLRAVTKQIAEVKDGDNPQRQLDAVLRALQEFLGADHDETTIAERWKDLDQRTKDWQELGTKHAALTQLRQELATDQRSVDLQKARLDQLGEEVKKIDKKYKELKKLKRCPTCGSKGTNLAEALKLAEEAEVRRLASESEAALKEHKLAEQELENSAKRLKAAEEHQQKGVELDEERQKLEDEQQLITLWKRHDELSAELSQQGVQYDLQGLEGRRYDIECEMQDQVETNGQIELELQTISYKRSQKKQLEQVETELQGVEEAWETCNKQVKELELLRDRLTAMSLEPLLATLGRFTKGIFAEPLSLQGTELGRMVGSRWVPLGQFSGSEQAVAVTALSCALRGNPKHKNLVIADELSSFDDVHLAQFLTNVTEAIGSGILDQFIGFSTPRKSSKALPKSVEVRLI